MWRLAKAFKNHPKLPAYVPRVPSRERQFHCVCFMLDCKSVFGKILLQLHSRVASLTPKCDGALGHVKPRWMPFSDRP